MRRWECFGAELAGSALDLYLGRSITERSDEDTWVNHHRPILPAVPQLVTASRGGSVRGVGGFGCERTYLWRSGYGAKGVLVTSRESAAADKSHTVTNPIARWASVATRKKLVVLGIGIAVAGATSIVS